MIFGRSRSLWNPEHHRKGPTLAHDQHFPENFRSIHNFLSYIATRKTNIGCHVTFFQERKNRISIKECFSWESSSAWGPTAPPTGATRTAVSNRDCPASRRNWVKQLYEDLREIWPFSFNNQDQGALIIKQSTILRHRCTTTGLN